MVTQVFYTNMPGPLEREKLNELWNRQSGEFTSTSVSSVLMGTGAKSFQVQSGKGYVVGQRIGMLALSAPANYMLGTVTSYAGTTLGVTVDEVAGAGTFASWLICTSTEFPAVSGAVMAEFGKRALGAHQFLSYNRGSVLCHVGDSNTVARPAWRAAYEPGWLGVGGIFEGWTSYNLGANGSTAGSWVADIATGNQGEAPADYIAGGPRGGQPWQVVNARPDVIVLALGTNDFRMGAGPASLTARTAQFRADMATLINFFLSRTNASILLRLPQPLAYASPDPDSYTDFVNADDAAARSAAMRAVYLEWINISDRVKVMDSHKHIFGYRIDSVAASVDPETGGAMMSDTLHPLALGYVRQVQVIAKLLNPNLPYTTKYNAVPDTVYKTAYWARTVQVLGSGANFVDVESDPQAAGTVLLRDTPVRSPLGNIQFANFIGRAAGVARYRELEMLGEMYAYFHDTNSTVGPFTIASIIDFPLNGWVRCLTSALAFGGKSGPCTLYVLAAKEAPNARSTIFPIHIDLCGPQPLGTGASGGRIPGYTDLKTYTVLKMDAWRDDPTGAAVVNVYAGANVTGGITAGPAYPGLLLGSLTFTNGFRWYTTWAPDPTNFPGGVASFANNTVLQAVCQSGTLGKAASVTVYPK